MPDPNSDADQLRFAQIRGRMLEGIAQHCSTIFLENAGVSSRSELLKKLRESQNIMEIVDCCAYAAQCMEEESRRRRYKV